MNIRSLYREGNIDKMMVASSIMTVIIMTMNRKSC